ncbi:MAG: restriction endonuclease subunit S [Anaerolineae bacterium]|nr:restriction endonuclease subunit S [Anaerolineae bacterium]
MSHSLPDGWRWVNLEEVIEPSTDITEIEDNREYAQITVKMHHKGVVLREKQLGKFIGTKRQNRIHVGQFIISKIDARNGACAIVPPELDDAVATFDFPTFDVNADIDTGYLDFYTSTRRFVRACRDVSIGTTNRSRLQMESFGQIEIPLPPLDEQCRIAAVLRNADANIARVEDAIAAAQEVKRGVMRRLFTYGLGDEHTETRRADFGHVPNHWQTAPLEQYAHIQTGAAKGRDFNGGRVISVPYLRVANVQDGYLDLTEIKYIEIREDELERYSLQPGDVVLTEGGDLDKLGRGFIWHGEIPNCIHQNHVFAVRVNTDYLTPEYLAYLVQSDYGRAYFLSAAKQTTNLASINSSQLKAFPLLLPDLEEQLELAAILRIHDDTIRTMHVEHESLCEVKRGLMQGLLSGRVRV